MIPAEQAKEMISNIRLNGLSEQDSISDLINLLIVADDAYFNDDEVMQDYEYDSIKRFVHLAEPTNPYFLGVGSEVRGGKVKLPYQMGSLDQVYEGELQSFISTRRLTLADVLIVSDKLDGASGMVVYDSTGKFQIAYSRGDGIEGADISRHLKQMSTVPTQIKSSSLTIRGENIISIPNFEKARSVARSRSGKPYKNARNMVSGLMNAESNPAEVYQFIDFVAYEIVGSTLGKYEQLHILHALGFKTPFFEDFVVSDVSEHTLTQHIKTRRIQNKEFGYEIDGIVVEVDDADIRARINPTRDTLNPAYAFKYKVADESNLALATVVDVDINISKDGYLKPRVQINPVELVGVTVTWATGFNMKFIVDNKIQPGSRVRITRSGDVIPFITGSLLPILYDEEKYQLWLNAKINQFEKTKWTDTKVDLVLVDTESNPTVKFERLVDFFAGIDAAHLGEGNLQKMFDLGFEVPEEIIEMSSVDLGVMVGSSSIGKKIYDGLCEKLTNIPLYKLMGAHPAFGRGVGVRKMRKLYDAFKGDMSLCQYIDKIVMVEGFDTKTAQKVQAGYPKFMEFLSKVKDYVTIAPYEEPKIGGFSGVTVVFTGFRDGALEKLIEAAGGKMGSSVSSKTGIVVAANPNETSGKLAKARQLGIKIIGVDELKEML